jgi:hypothetical protein
MEIQTFAGFLKLKGVTVGRCPTVVKVVFRALSEPRPFKALKAVATITSDKGQSVLGASDESHWWETEDTQIRQDGYYFLALRFLGLVKEVSLT